MRESGTHPEAFLYVMKIYISKQVRKVWEGKSKPRIPRFLILSFALFFTVA